MSKSHKDKTFLPDQKRLNKETSGSKGYSEGDLLNSKNLNKLHAKDDSPKKNWVDTKGDINKGMERGWEERHEKMQLGSNPMLMTDFEKSLVEQEKKERYLAKLRYDLGIQGVDGGRFPRGQT